MENTSASSQKGVAPRSQGRLHVASSPAAPVQLRDTFAAGQLQQVFRTLRRPPWRHIGLVLFLCGAFLASKGRDIAGDAAHAKRRLGLRTSNCRLGMIDLALAADESVIHAVGPLVASTQKSAREPRCLKFHVIVPAQSAAHLRTEVFDVLSLHQLGPKQAEHEGSGANAGGLWQLSGGATVQVVSFNSSAIQNSMKVVTSETPGGKVCDGLEGCDGRRAARLRKATNFARFFLASLLPDLDKVMWVDCDVLIQRDLRALWDTALPASSKNSKADVIAAFVEPAPFGRFYFDKEAVANLWNERNKEVDAKLHFEGTSFNDGAVVLDLALWRKLDLSKDVQWWMEKHQQADPGLWKFGTQPIMLLVTHGRWQKLPEEWYAGDLGFSKAKEVRERATQATVLHFDGEHKPWLPAIVSEINRNLSVREGWNGEIFEPYTPPSAAPGWPGAPGARCLLSTAHAQDLSPCEVGPIIPGVPLHGLRWIAGGMRSMADHMDASKVHTLGDEKPKMATLLDSENTLHMLDISGDAAVFATPVGLRPSAGVLHAADFSQGPLTIEIFFRKPMRLMEIYLQSTGLDTGFTASPLLESSKAIEGRATWEEACISHSEPVACQPGRGPAFTAGGSLTCWRMVPCGPAVRHWRLSDWISPGNALASMWLTAVPGEVLTMAQ